MIFQSRVTILVKASPQPSKTHNETVCCAGLEADGKWKRLFPIRFRRLSGDKAFSRWDTVDFEYSQPKHDTRPESCRVHEESISIPGRVSNPADKSSLVQRATVPSERYAIEQGASLALIRPRNVSMSWRRLSENEIDKDRQKFRAQAAQLSLLEEEIAAYEPCPYKISMSYEDEGGRHKKTCADWETSATFFKRRHDLGEEGVLEHLRHTYCEQYVERGLVFALGNMARRPQTWQLLGIFPVPEAMQDDLFN